MCEGMRVGMGGRVWGTERGGCEPELALRVRWSGVGRVGSSPELALGARWERGLGGGDEVRGGWCCRCRGVGDLSAVGVDLSLRSGFVGGGWVVVMADRGLCPRQPTWAPLRGSGNLDFPWICN